MRVLFGTDQPLEVYRVDADAKMGKAKLLAEAERINADRSIPSQVTIDDSPSGAQLAGRLSAVDYPRPLDGQRTVEVVFPENVDDIGEMLMSIAAVWPKSSAAPPTWVACDDPVLEAVLARTYKCKRGLPRDVERTHHTPSGPPGVGPDGPLPDKRAGGKPSVGPLFGVMGLLLWLLSLQFALRTSAGRDFQSRVMGDTASNGTGSYAAANWIGLTENAVAPADGDTTLAGELTTTGLTRAQAAYSHTAGASTYLLVKTFTSGDGTTRTIAKIGVFNANAAGTMVFSTLLSATAVIVSGDQVAITETVTL